MTIEEKKQKDIDEKQLEEETNQIEKELSRKSELFAQASENKRYTWQDVQHKLKKGEATIEIIKFRTFYLDNFSDTIYYAALLITPQTKDNPEVIVFENGNELEGKYLNNYQNNIKFQKIDKFSYIQYWQKIAERLKKAKIKKVYISADGVYNQINLSTLQNPQTGKYLQEEIEIQLVSNTKDIITRPAEKKTIIQNGVFIGYPDYNKGEKTDSLKKEDERNLSLQANVRLDTTQRFFDGANISELPGTKVEVENIQAIFDKNKIQSKSYLSTEATEELIKSLQSPQILHIATHGFFLQNIEEKGNENERSFMGTENQKALDNPLLRSGLLFAGATQVLNNKAKDGILTAYEAMNLDLDNTELVVLSACETGLGKISNGEGVYGLQRAFQVAGARAVLMSL
jgi:CHAT domain-containing protein